MAKSDFKNFELNEKKLFSGGNYYPTLSEVVIASYENQEIRAQQAGGQPLF